MSRDSLQSNSLVMTRTAQWTTTQEGMLIALESSALTRLSNKLTKEVNQERKQSQEEAVRVKVHQDQQQTRMCMC